jgi:hypothetical protein
MLQFIRNNIAFIRLNQRHPFDQHTTHSTMMLLCTVVVALCCFVSLVRAGIGMLKDQSVNLKQLAGSRATMYTLEDTRTKIHCYICIYFCFCLFGLFIALGDAQPYLQFNVTVTGNATAVWVIFAFSTYQRMLTHELSNGDNVICCSRAVRENTNLFFFFF